MRFDSLNAVKEFAGDDYKKRLFIRMQNHCCCGMMSDHDIMRSNKAWLQCNAFELILCIH